MHVNKRLKSRPKVQLPVKDLILQYQDPQVAPFVSVRVLKVQSNCLLPG